MSALRVVRVGPGATVQDLGRPGWMHHGVPPGGPLVRARALAANRSLGNDDGDAVVELPLHAATLRAESPLTLSVDGRVHRLASGEALTVRPEGAVAYVALPGGVEVPRALGSRGTLLVAALGGVDGRALRAGDVLRGRRATARVAVDHPVPRAEGVITVVPGPDAFPRAALEALYAGAFAMTATRDRVGMRLAGDALRPFARAADGASTPMVRGALELTPEGALIALGPDHPTTGGYPVIAVVAARAQDALADLRPGAPLRFSPA